MSTDSSTGQRFERVPLDSLPIFMLPGTEWTIFYAPRFAEAVPTPAAKRVLRYLEHRAYEELPEHLAWTLPEPAAWCAFDLVRSARRVVREVEAAAHDVTRFECLTVCANNRCNLRCHYCYAGPDGVPSQPISAQAVRAAARLVAGDCATRGIPLTLALHGGGEPMLDVAAAGRIIDIAASEAQRAGVTLWAYTATNGVVPPDTARWMAARFDLVGISCDGPPEFHDRNRIARDGSRTSGTVARTMEIMRQQARRFVIRITLTREMLSHEAEIVAHLAERYAPCEIRLEPVYRASPATSAFQPSDAAAFVAGFLAARAAANSWGIPVTTSLTRPREVYGRYCHVFRRVLSLVPGDVATLCFLAASRAAVSERGVQTGALCSDGIGFTVYEDRLRMLAGQCSTVPDTCRDCVCSFQCTFGCPEVCALAPPDQQAVQGSLAAGFRCRANRLLLEALVGEAVGRAWGQTGPGRRRDRLDEQTKLRVVIDRRGSGQETLP